LLTGDVTGLRGVDLGVRDVAAQARFYTEVWRLTLAAERNGSVYLRGSGAYCHVLALHPRSEPALLCLNLAAADRAAVDRLHARVAAAGAPEVSPPAPITEPGGGYGFAFTDPEGRSVRVIAQDARHADARSLPDRPEKITHVVLNTPRQEEAAAFWVQALGFEISDRSLLTFIRCNSDHHSIAFHPGEISSLHHIAFEMDGIDSVMRGAGRMRDAGHPIAWGPGRHGPGNNVFAYFVGPDGFVIEYTAEIGKVAANHRVREPGEWVYPPGHSDLWGVTAPPTDWMKAAQKKIGFAPGLFRP
jgi:catechol 2,3-dioxygenase-like lactoylglutathione lyase family enzyme/predicted enzyme related to lactoylglutathione lyase